jgi:hypothetical protein
MGSVAFLVLMSAEVGLGALLGREARVGEVARQTRSLLWQGRYRRCCGRNADNIRTFGLSLSFSVKQFETQAVLSFAA